MSQPSRAPLCQVLLHLFPQGSDRVRRRSQLDHEIRAQRQKLLLLLVTQFVEPGLRDPGRVRRASSTARQPEASGGIEGYTAAVALGPLSELESDFRVAS